LKNTLVKGGQTERTTTLEFPELRKQQAIIPQLKLAKKIVGKRRQTVPRER